MLKCGGDGGGVPIAVNAVYCAGDLWDLSAFHPRLSYFTLVACGDGSVDKGGCFF